MTTHRNAAGVVACLAFAWLVSAAEATEVQVVLRSARGEGATEAVLAAVPVGGRSTGAALRLEPVERRVPLPWQGSLELDSRAIWRLSARAPGFWAPEVVVLPDPERPSPVEVRLWASASLSGALSLPPGEPVPKDLKIRFSPTPRRSSGGVLEPPEGTVVCPVQELRWNCEVPAGRMDLWLRASGFISHYRWGLDLVAGKALALGDLALRRGASVVGFVEVEDGALDPRNCKVTLAPSLTGLPAGFPDLSRRQRLPESVQVEERGFFHFQGVRPGSYVLTAEQRAWAPAHLFPLLVQENSETQLRELLLLRRPVTLRLEVEPPVDPAGERWTVRLAMSSPSSPSRLEVVNEAEATSEGLYSKDGLSPATYVLQVIDSQGGSVAWEEVSLDRLTEPIRVALELTRVEGRVRLGEEPLAAKLSFGGGHGAVRVAMVADGDGEFAGILPRPGRWKVEVEAEAPVVRRSLWLQVVPEESSGLARLEIVLPDSRVAGETVDEAGKPLGGAFVKATEPLAGEALWVRSDDEGRFSFSGIAEGTLILDAEWQDRSSRPRQADPQVLTVAKGRHSEDVRLVLHELAQVSGVVIGGGEPVPGAVVELLPKRGGREVPFANLPRGNTDVQGRFRIDVPAEADRFDLRLFPPGFVLYALSGLAPPREPLTAVVEPFGGTLVLHSDELTSLDDRGRPRPVLFHEGVPFDILVLQQWAMMNGERNADRSRLVVPQLPPGEYTACWVTLDAYLKAVLVENPAAQEPPASVPQWAAVGRCASGQLGVFGELRLEMPGLDEEPPAGGATAEGRPKGQ